MRYLIDTTVVIPYLANDEATIDLLRHLAGDGIAIGIRVYLEAYEGVIGHPSQAEARRKFDAFVRDVPILPVSTAVARRCAELRLLLRQQGKNPRRRGFDLVIAATALEHDLELVTHNARDYADIPNLIRFPL